MEEDNLYLIKFVTKQKHATSIQNGYLFMLPAFYYYQQGFKTYAKRFKGEEVKQSNLKILYESGKWLFIDDVYEGYAPIKAENRGYSIMSFYLSNSSQLVLKKGQKFLKLDEKLLTDFKNNGYTHMLIIEFSSFIDKLEKTNPDMLYSRIHYGNIERNHEDLKKVADNSLNCPLNLFYKMPIFSNQQEFRLVHPQSQIDRLHSYYNMKKRRCVGIEVCQYIRKFKNGIEAPYKKFKEINLKNFPYKPFIGDLKNCSIIYKLDDVINKNNFEIEIK